MDFLVWTFFLSILVFVYINFLLGPNWKRDGVLQRLAQSAGADAKVAHLAISLASMVSHFGVGNILGGIENAIELFMALDAGKRDLLLETLRDVGRNSGNGTVEYILDDFATYLEQRGDQAEDMMPQTAFRFVLNMF